MNALIAYPSEERPWGQALRTHHQVQASIYDIASCCPLCDAVIKDFSSISLCLGEIHSDCGESGVRGSVVLISDQRVRGSSTAKLPPQGPLPDLLQEQHVTVDPALCTNELTHSSKGTCLYINTCSDMLLFPW